MFGLVRLSTAVAVATDTAGGVTTAAVAATTRTLTGLIFGVFVLAVATITMMMVVMVVAVAMTMAVAVTVITTVRTF